MIKPVLAVGLVLLFGCLVPAVAQNPSFATGTDFEYSEPNAAATGDFNGDGHLDIAVMDGNSVCMLFGDGAGNYQPGPCTLIAVYGFFLFPADLNGDGKLDLVTGAMFSPTSYLIIAFGNGDGTFQLPVVETQYLGVVTSMAVGALGDSTAPDIVVGTNLGVSVFLNNGDGTFQSPVNYLSNVPIFGVTVGRLAGHRLPAIIAGTTTGLSILLGLPGKTFTAGPTLTIPGTRLDGPKSIAVADFNQDGIPDILACGVKFPPAGDVYLFLGNGKNSFAPMQQIPVAGPAEFLTVGDINGDGIPDFVAVTSNTRNLDALIGTGDGTFHSAGLYAVKVADSLALAPMRSGGALDAVVASSGNYGVSILANRGNGTFRDPIHVNAPGGGTMAVADFNRDGHPDIAVQGGAGITVLSGTGNARQPFQVSPSISLPGNFVAAGDFNGDGNPDIAVDLTSGNVAVLLGDGTGGFGQPILSAAGVPYTFIFAADVNDDGKLDLITTYGTVLYGNGDGTFQAPVTIFPLTTDLWWVATGDFNRDGKTDIAYINGAPSLRYVQILLGQGGGAFEILPPYLLPTKGIYDNTGNSIAAADLNGDGVLDLVVGTAAGLSVLVGNGDGTFIDPIPYDAMDTYNAFGVTIGDFNGDGYPDAALATDYNSDVEIFLGNGDGTFQLPQSSWGTGIYDQIIVSGHFHGQTGPGLEDLVTTSADGVDVLINNTQTK